jgi:hypothetical protein
MNIKKQDYLDLGISKEILDFVEEDKDGFIRHPIHQQIGSSEFPETLYFLVAEKLGYKPMIDNSDLDKIENDFNTAVLAWFNSKAVLNHVWNPKESLV